MTWASGLHGLFRLDGGPVDDADAVAFGVATAPALNSAVAVGLDGATLHAVHRSDAAGTMTILVGALDRPTGLADRLSLAHDTGPADLARAAVARYGADAPREMLGEWTLLQWDHGTLTIMASMARRDRVFFTVSGQRCAVSSDLLRMSGLSWVGREIDDVGLLFEFARAAVREHKGDRTMLRGVQVLAPGASATITRSGVRMAQAPPLEAQPRWQGSCRDAVAEAETLLREIVRERLGRSPAPALLLSGGLDSALLAWALAAQRESGQTLHFLTSVAPDGSGLPDEFEYAGQVAHALGHSCHPVSPPLEADAYRPSLHAMRGGHGPIFSSRAPLTEAFHDAARAIGATGLINGTYGEMNLTGRLPYATPRQRLLDLARRVKHGGTIRSVAPDAQNAFNVRLATGRRASLPDALRAALAAPPPPPYARRPTDLWGYPPGVQSALDHPNEFHPGALRMDFPFRDVRLTQLFAGFPMPFFRDGGLDRAPARMMLDGRLPDSIRLRTMGMPASPDHMVRLQRQASAARARLPVFRRAGLDEWFDLEWLDIALGHIATRGPRNVVEANAVQLTAINAEYLAWWRGADQ